MKFEIMLESPKKLMSSFIYPVVNSSLKKYPQKRREVSPTKIKRRTDEY
jgi:hypothetical protein